MKMNKKIICLFFCLCVICSITNAQITDYVPQKGEKLKEMEGRSHIAKGYVKDNKFVDGSPIEIRLKNYGDESNIPVILGIYKEIDGKSYILGTLSPREAYVLTGDFDIIHELGHEGDQRALGLFQIYNTPEKILSPKKLPAKRTADFRGANFLKIEITDLQSLISLFTRFGGHFISEGCIISQTKEGDDIIQTITVPDLKIQPYKRIYRKANKIEMGNDLENLGDKADWIIEFETGEIFYGKIADVLKDNSNADGYFIDKDGTKVTGRVKIDILKGEGIVPSYKKIKDTAWWSWPDSIIFTDGTFIPWEWFRDDPKRVKIFNGANDTKDLKRNYDNYLISETQQNKELERIKQEKINNFELNFKHYNEYIQKTYPSFSSQILKGEIEIGMTTEAVSYSLYFRIINLFMAANELGEVLNSKTNTFNIENFTFDKYNLNTLYTVGSKTPYSETYIINGNGRFMELPYRSLEFVNGKLYSFSK